VLEKRIPREIKVGIQIHWGSERFFKKYALHCQLISSPLVDVRNKLLPGITIKANGVAYTADRIIGHGSFGVVFQATTVGSGEIVAIKKVLQDKRFKVSFY